MDFRCYPNVDGAEEVTTYAVDSGSREVICPVLPIPVD